jgi:hypothetical protein
MRRYGYAPSTSFLALLLLSQAPACAKSDNAGFEETTGEAGTEPITPGADAGSEAGSPPSSPHTCVHHDDCKAVDLCKANNGVACVGGFCVPTGKPMNCDDGIACTSDACDLNKNACVHTPSDAACPASSYCDPTVNCVQTLPCASGDSVCDRLNTSACDGIFSCEPTKKYCVRAPKPCQDRANAATKCTASGLKTTCAWSCNASYSDVDKDLASPATSTSNGCECQITSTIDKPTLAMVDGNCDGIVGNAANAVFVDTITGADANPGTMLAPKKTIQAAISAAAAAVPVKDVYVSKGTYAETVSLASGVSVYGGYDAASAWSRAATNVTLIASPQTVGVIGANLNAPTEIQLLDIRSADAFAKTPSGDGTSSIGVRITGSAGVVTIRGCNIQAGAGSAGTKGTDGATGSPGGNGGSAIGISHGAAGTGCNGASGGVGADGVNGAAPGLVGGSGVQVVGGGAGIVGGGGGAGGTCSASSSSNGSPAPAVTTAGGSGNAGANGLATLPFGAFDASGNYLPAIGGDGIASGTAGGGGGGGGSGGGSAHGTNFVCSNCTAISSGGGGGGGGGGCGGAVGRGGRGGGGSFAVVAVSSQVTVDTSHMVTSTGGSGGAGGAGGVGGAGGAGGVGAAGDTTNNSCSARSGGSGAAGSAGGAGGRAGGGAGGTGGPSVCIVFKGTSPTSAGNVCTTAGGGPGGPGGTNGLAVASNGLDGVAVDLRSSP